MRVSFKWKSEQAQCQNLKNWNTHVQRKLAGKSEEMTIGCPMSVDEVIGPYLIEEPTVSAKIYINLLSNAGLSVL